MVSLKDIAQRCGVSVATVSKALNWQQDVNEETKRRVIDTAKEMGYIVNTAARALRTNRTFNLGILYEDLQHSGFMHEYFASLLTYFRFEAERKGYDISFISGNVGHQCRSFLQHANYRGVDGVAIICADFESAPVQELVCSRLPVVTLDHTYNNRTALLSDNTEGMAALVRYAYGKGHRRIAYIHGNQTAVTERRLIGFYRTCEELGLPVPDEYVGKCQYHDPDSCYGATKELLALPKRPTCILFSDDYSYIGGATAIREAGLRVPDDISVAGYDGTNLSKVISPHLTTWQQNTEELGRLAASKLIERIEHPRTAIPEHITVSGSLLAGETIRALDEAEHQR